MIDPELHAWARKAFRPATMHGRLPARRGSLAARLLTPGPRTEVIGINVRAATRAAFYAGVVGVGFLIGRWWTRRHPPETMIGFDLLGCDDA